MGRHVREIIFDLVVLISIKTLLVQHYIWVGNDSLARKDQKEQASGTLRSFDVPHRIYVSLERNIEKKNACTSVVIEKTQKIVPIVKLIRRLFLSNQ